MESEIDAFAEGFKKTNFFDDKKKWYVNAQKVENNFEISISVNRSTSSNPQDLEFFVKLRNNMQTLFPNNKVIFNLVVDNLNNVVKPIE